MARQLTGIAISACVVLTGSLLLGYLTVEPACATPGEEALRKLAQKGIQCNELSFFELLTNRDTEAIKLFLAAGMSPNTKDVFGHPALLLAVGLDYLEGVQLLLGAGADVNANGKDGMTALLEAAKRSGEEEVVKALLRSKADVNARNKYGWTAWMLAVKNGHTELLSILRQAGAVERGAKEAELIARASTGDLGSVQSLIQAGADVNIREDSGSTALIEATRWGHAEVVKALAKAGADLNADNYGSTSPGGSGTALMVAANMGYVDLVRLLIELGADINAREDRDGLTALIWAIYGNSPEVLRVLIQAGAEYGEHELECAAQRNHADMARMLLHSKAEVGKKGAGALQIAASRGEGEIVKLLIQAGADVNAKDTGGMTALLMASGEIFKLPSVAQTLRAGVVLTLIQAGADVNVKDRTGRTPLMVATQSGYTEIVRLLREAGARE